MFTKRKEATMGQRVPLQYLYLGKNDRFVLQDFFWVIKPVDRENKICVIDAQVMIFSSKEKALAFLGSSKSQKFMPAVLFWHEVVFCHNTVRGAVLDFEPDGDNFRIWIDLVLERRDLSRNYENVKGVAK